LLRVNPGPTVAGEAQYTTVVPGKNTPMASAVRYSEMAFAIPVAAVLGYYLGLKLDEHFGKHFLAVTGVILGAVGGLVHTVRVLLRDSGDGS
jgi:hypothetical protein